MRDMTKQSYEQLDDLFNDIRLCLVSVRKSDPETGNKLKGLVRQLEMWVDSLVVDSLKLKGLEAEAEKRRKLVKGLMETLDNKSKTD